MTLTLSWVKRSSIAETGRKDGGLAGKMEAVIEGFVIGPPLYIRVCYYTHYLSNIYV